MEVMQFWVVGDLSRTKDWSRLCFVVQLPSCYCVVLVSSLILKGCSGAAYASHTGIGRLRSFISQSLNKPSRDLHRPFVGGWFVNRNVLARVRMLPPILWALEECSVCVH